MQRIAIQMDDPAGFNPVGDSTIALGLEAQKRGAELFYYRPEYLSYEQGRITASDARAITFYDDLDLWYEQGEPITLDLTAMDAVLIRQDPPFDMAYITSTYLLEGLPDSVRVLNNPAAIRNLPEKWYALKEFAGYMPPTLITRDSALVRDFLKQQNHIVMKPLYGYGGKGVFHFDQRMPNFEATIEHAFLTDPLPWIFQRFLPEVKTEDRRVILMNGNVSAVLGRIPAEGEIRANFRTGGTGAEVELTPKQAEICDKVGAAMRAHQIHFAGLDLIGDYLTEINVTSPTGIRIAQKLYGTNPAAEFWDSLNIIMDSHKERAGEHSAVVR